ncbi:ORF334 [White spot syndrome virus]|uniref:Wsv298 n=3 Tax=White spot syndrome virus TaxID=342409 RepID=Q8VAT8_WSSVS|nr:wsv298 [Shrimp white spot syndrome virus]AFX59675.1 wsv298 [White spot syndrome virus]AAL33300.1 wsv298 [Shrimp white spot syndrome virus]AAL89222.1 WSSV354 [Shrimp white spot syndrome virus]ATU84215.1 ORF334 [White spot syndrome virus]AWQ60430.1 wsv298 [Shrimp white spot syndrome virus]
MVEKKPQNCKMFFGIQIKEYIIYIIFYCFLLNDNFLMILLGEGIKVGEGVEDTIVVFPYT